METVVVQWMLTLLLQAPPATQVYEVNELYESKPECVERYNELVSFHKEHIRGGGQVKVRIECLQVEVLEDPTI